MATALITGGGRGIGFELARQLVQLPSSQISTVFVTTRGSPSDGLKELMASANGRLVNIHCEITQEASVRQAAVEIESKLEGRGLDILINNAGMMPFTPAGVSGMSGDQLSSVFQVNVISAQQVTSSLLPALRRSQERKIVMVSSSVGSLAHADRYTWAPTPEYKITKAAMNMLSLQYALDLEKDGFTVLTVSPGWLKTDMGSDKADLDVDTGVDALKKLILGADTSKNGKFYNIHVPGWEHAEGPNQYDGAEIPW